mgnify:CR=1 FL=1
MPTSPKQLDTTNPDHITYEHPPLEVTVLGGIRLEGLDRMRATLKIKTEEQQAVRHNLDLYNNIQVEKLIRRVAERLEIGTSVITAALVDLTEELEDYRMRTIEQMASADQKPHKMLTPEEIKTTKLYATAPNLMQRIGDDLQATGIIGEWENALIEYIVMGSRKCNDPLSVITLARSGMGKSYLQEKVAATMPQEDIIESTQITESSFYRFGRHELSGKIFLIEDLDGAEDVLYPIREMQTKKRISKTVTLKDSQGQMKTMTLIVEGPISVCGCTTKESVYEDNANRSLLLHLDGSKEQDKRIMDYSRNLKAGLVDQEKEETTREQLEHLQRILLPKKIINPYAIYIELPQEVFKPRRTLTLLLSFIEAITYHHQYQREELADQHGEVYIETTPEDIEWAFKLLRDVLFRKSDELSGACREFYEWLIQSERKLNIASFFGSEIRKERRINPRTLSRYLQELTAYGKLQITGGNKYKTGYQYSLAEPTDNLQDSVDQQISKVLEQVKKAATQRMKKQKSA